MTAPSVVTWGRSWFADRARAHRSMRVTAHPGEGFVTVSLWDRQQCIGTLRLADSEVPALVGALTSSLLSGAAAPASLGVAPEGGPARGAAVGGAGTAQGDERGLASVSPLPLPPSPEPGASLGPEPATSATDAVSLWLHGPPTVP